MKEIKKIFFGQVWEFFQGINTTSTYSYLHVKNMQSPVWIWYITAFIWFDLLDVTTSVSNNFQFLSRDTSRPKPEQAQKRKALFIYHRLCHKPKVFPLITVILQKN